MTLHQRLSEATEGTRGHTPGPWRYVPGTEHHGPYVATDAEMTYGDIADLYVMSKPGFASTRNGGESYPINHQGATAEANARLMAAAPELLASLQEVVAIADRNTDAFDRAKAAIAKATASPDTGEGG